MKIEKTFKIEIKEDTKFCGENCQYLKDGWCKFTHEYIINHNGKDMGRSEQCFIYFGEKPKNED